MSASQQLEPRPYDRVKRAIDVVAAALLLVGLSPLLFIVGGVVRAALGRPVLFRQARVGRGGRIFRIAKFRSMRDLRPGEVEDVQTDAARLGSFGRALRATSLDELPELWNVLRGEMSLVGPRPLLPEYLPLYTTVQARRHEVRPGITGLAQVRGRNLLDWASRFELDVYYVDHRSFSLDTRILFLTIGQVFRGAGVSQPGTDSAHRFVGER